MNALVASLAAKHGDRILRAIRQAPDGMTDFELADTLGMFLSSVNAARNTLVRQNLVKAGGKRRPSGRGGMATVWVDARPGATP